MSARAAEHMSALEAVAVVHRARGESDVVITTMTTARDWMTLAPHPLDLVFVPSAMSHATSMALGIALAQPTRRVIACNGDGSMLMNLGSLVSIAGAGAANVVIVLFDNGVYEVTGSQPTPASRAVDFAAIAKGAGFGSVFELSAIGEWASRAPEMLGAPGPVFVWLHVADTPGVPGPRSPGPAAARAERFRAALAKS